MFERGVWSVKRGVSGVPTPSVGAFEHRASLFQCRASSIPVSSVKRSNTEVRALGFGHQASSIDVRVPSVEC